MSRVLIHINRSCIVIQRRCISRPCSQLARARAFIIESIIKPAEIIKPVRRCAPTRKRRCAATGTLASDDRLFIKRRTSADVPRTISYVRINEDRSKNTAGDVVPECYKSRTARSELRLKPLYQDPATSPLTKAHRVLSGNSIMHYTALKHRARLSEKLQKVSRKRHLSTGQPSSITFSVLHYIFRTILLKKLIGTVNIFSSVSFLSQI